VLEALKISAYHLGAKPIIDYINSKDFEGPSAKKNLEKLRHYHGILVPGGFGSTGIEGKINAIRFAREKKIPYFGLCYGMQLMVIEYARNVVGFKGAHTTEVDAKTKYPVIDIMEDQKKNIEKGIYGATMRLGAYPAHLKKGTIARGAYDEEMISERHRHRYEVNPKFIPDITGKGLVFSGTSPDGKLMEIAELPRSKHPFFLGTQFHPEFTARPIRPQPLFTEFLKAAIAQIKAPIKIADSKRQTLA
jgi:CTP synthase